MTSKRISKAIWALRLVPNQIKKNGAVTRIGIVPAVSMMGSAKARNSSTRALANPSATPTTHETASATTTFDIV